MEQMKEKKDRLPILRQRLNDLLGDMSTTDFAKKVGISRQTMGFYLNGDRIPDAVILQQICTACNVSSDWLLGFSNDRNRTPGAVDELGLSELAVENIINYANARGFEDVLPGLNMLIESGRFLTEVACAYRFRDFIRESSRIERSYSSIDQPYINIAVQERDYTNFSISELLEDVLFKEYPALKGHFKVVGGATAVKRKKEDLDDSFADMLSELTGYASYIKEVEQRNCWAAEIYHCTERDDNGND